MQIAQPPDAWFFLAQVVEEVGLELVVARAPTVLVLGSRTRLRDVRRLESFAADGAEERDGEFQLSIES